MAGPFKKRSNAVVKAGIIAIKFDEFAARLQAKGK